MARRNERIINDKFYFVLDEVGPSDCESEGGNEVETKERALCIKDKMLGQEFNGVNSTNTKEVSDMVDSNSKHLDTYRELGDSISEKANSCIKLENDDSSNSCLNNKLVNKEKVGNHEEVNINNSVTPTTGEPSTINNMNLKPDQEYPENECNKNEILDMDIESEGEYIEPEIVDAKPLVKFTFQDAASKKRFKSSLTRFFYKKIGDCKVVESKDNLGFEIFDNSSKSRFKKGLLNFDLDTNPTHGHHDVPHYGKSHDLFLSDKSLENDKKDKLSASTVSCFNCLGNHCLRDCTEVRDIRAINENRLKAQLKTRASKLSKTRYHLHANQKYGNILPGVISRKLRNALDLRSNQIPSFIYRMRLLGYPPAWLEEAKVPHSGIAMYNSNSDPVLEDDVQEGEIIPEGSKDKFDITKIIEFPGFNVPLPNNFKDEHQFYGCPKISEDQSKENLIKVLQPKTVQAYVKKSLTATKSEENTSDYVTNVPSPTIEEMEEKKRQLLLQMDNSDLDDEEDDDSKLSFSDSVPTTVNISDGFEEKEWGSVKNSEFGTPILKSVTPFSKLPSREQFSVNVSDVINFENLPNSTGKYESMRRVITKIRVSTSKTQTE